MILSFNFAYNTEQVHLKMYKDAKEAVDKKQDIELKKINVCPVCGYTIEGEAPDNCPICGAKKELFKIFE